MMRSWKPSLLRQWVGGPGVPWMCQLVFAEIEAGTLVLDLVALEPAPAHPDACPRSTPFTLHIGTSASDASFREALRQWVGDADVVAITFGQTNRTPWLSLSSAGHHLVLELCAPGP